MRRFLVLIFLASLAAVAYTYGAKAGRGRYRDIKATVDAIWNDPRVKKARKEASKEAQRLSDAAEKKARKALKSH